MRLFNACGAKTRSGTPCRRPATPGKQRCRVHGGRSTGPITPEGKARSQAAKLAGAASWRERQRAKITLGLATRFPSGRKSNAERERLAAARSAAQAATAPEWPRDGYHSSADARRLEAREREFIRSLAAPINLELELARTGSHLASLSARETEQVVTAFVQAEQQRVAQCLDHLTKSEAFWRRPNDGAASQQRLARLQWEADDYLARLRTQRLVLVLQAADRERQSREAALELTERIIAGRDQAWDERAASPRPREVRVPLTIDPRFK
jgi:hypothetical protein